MRRSTAQLRTVLATAVAFLAAGCGVDVPGTVEAPKEPSAATTLPDGWTTCENQVYGYLVGYPETWFTTDILNGEQDPRFACQWFSPRPFDQVDDQGRPLGNLVMDGFAYPVEIYFWDFSLADSVEPWTDADKNRVLIQEDVHVDGHTAVKLEVRTLDDPIAEPGRHYLYVIELDDSRSMFVHTTETRGVPGDYQENKQILDQVVETILVGESGSPA